MTPGNQRAYIVTRRVDDRTEFLKVSSWDGYDAIAAFAGEDVEQAVFFPEHDRFLVDREATVQHFVVH